MKFKVLLLFLLVSLAVFSQETQRISTIDFVEVLNDNRKEALFYYQNNWQVLRKMAIEKEYILSYQLIEIPVTDRKPYDFILITTYANDEQYAMREDRFQELIMLKGSLKLLNAKKPNEFRKTVNTLEGVKHLN